MAREIQAVIIAIALLFLIPLVGAEVYPQNSEIDLKVPVRVNGFVSSGVLCNVSVFYPNKSLLIDFKQMTDKGNYFNYTLTSSQTTLKGDYSYCVTCQASSVGLNQTECFPFTINLGGVASSQERTDTTSRSIYFIFGIAIILFIGFFYSQKTPVKITFILMALLFMLIAINLIFLSLQDEIVNPRLESFFSFFTATSFIMYWFIGILLGVIWIITFIINIMSSMEVKKQKKYGSEWNS